MARRRRALKKQRDDTRRAHKQDRVGSYNHRANRCKQSFGKTKYSTRKVALTAASNARKTTNELIEAYKCTGCGEWHIGHTDPKQGRFVRGVLPGVPSKRNEVDYA